VRGGEYCGDLDVAAGAEAAPSASSREILLLRLAVWLLCWLRACFGGRDGPRGCVWVTCSTMLLEPTPVVKTLQLNELKGFRPSQPYQIPADRVILSFDMNAGAEGVPRGCWQRVMRRACVTCGVRHVCRLERRV
jgi:hypothetical protein